MKLNFKITRMIGVLAILLVVSGGLTVPAQAHAPGVHLTGVGTATIDGVISPGEWDDAGNIEFPVNLPEGGTTIGTLFVMNDESNLYLAIRFARYKVDSYNVVSFEFDNNHDGYGYGEGDDAIVFNQFYGFIDDFRTADGLAPRDIEYGGTNDGAGAFFNDGAFSVFELSHPLDSSDNLHDFSVGQGDTLGFFLSINITGVWPEYSETHFPSVAPYYGDIVIASLVLPVDIDIKPGSLTNPININSKGVIPVAILTNDDLDAGLVSAITVRFGPANATPSSYELEDVDADGDPDLMLYFNTQEVGFGLTDTEAELTGRTVTGQYISGTDIVSIVPTQE